MKQSANPRKIQVGTDVLVLHGTVIIFSMQWGQIKTEES